MSHTLVLSSYRFSFNDTLPSSMVMNGCVVCFPRKGNNELLLSMQFIETCYPIRLPEKLHRWLNFKNCDTIPMLSECFLFSFWSNCCCIPASMEVFLFFSFSVKREPKAYFSLLMLVRGNRALFSFAFSFFTVQIVWKIYFGRRIFFFKLFSLCNTLVAFKFQV